MYKFDEIVLGAFNLAQSEALERKNAEISAYHLLHGLLKNKSSYLSRVFKDKKNEVKSILNDLPTVTDKIDLDKLRPANSLNEWLSFSHANAVENARSEISERDLIKTMPKVLNDLDWDYSKLELNDESEVPDFLVNLNEKALNGKLDPVIGRRKEIRAIMEILARRTKNNPVLVGDAGVGKTAIIEGLTGEIINNNVPDVLFGKTIYSLDLGSLMADTKYRGDFEKKIKNLIEFMRSQNGEAILFIDEIHQLVGAGKTDGAMDAANLLKPALARGELHTIGATTFDEYQKYILNDGALDRRFRSVSVYEPTKEDSIEILMGLKEKYEMHHGIQISDEAIYSSVYLSDQYIKNKNLPDKAIDLIDEASASLKLSAETLPPELESMQLEIRSMLIKSKVSSNPELENQIRDLEKDFQEKKMEWDKRVSTLKRNSDLKAQKENLVKDLEKAEREGDYDLAGKIKYSLLPEIDKALSEQESFWILKREDIAQIISRHTKIPTEKILQEKQESLLELEGKLKEKIFGQDEVIHEISETLLSSMAGLTDPTKPLGSFLLLGPTGVGKTETAKQLANFLFNNEESLIRIDMSEYSEKHSISKLIGAPSGYVGYDEGGILTEAVRRKPFSILLFDEIEKAHYDFSDILLQILDDGRLTDNKGRTIDFRNTIVLLTSNSKNIEVDFKPEVLGRIDASLNYNPLDKSVMNQLVEKQLRIFNERISEKKITVQLSENLKSIVAERGFNDKFGARPLAQTFNLFIIRPMSKKLLKGEITQGDYLLDWKDSELVISERILK